MVNSNYLFSISSTAQQLSQGLKPLSEARVINSQWIERLTGKCEEIRHRLHIPGMSLAIVKNGEMANIALGVCNAETQLPVEENTLFEACSLSKQVFVELVFSLVENNELDLDEPLYKILSYERINHDPRHKAVTARMVLSHQMGLPNWGGDKLEFQFEPGTGFGYSGEAFGYLQKAIEKKQRKSLEALAQEKIFTPLGMTHSRFSWPEEEFVSLPISGHTEIGKPTVKSIPRNAHAACTLHCSASDFSKFLKYCLERECFRERILNKENTFVPSQMRADDAGEGKIAWGLGWGIQEGEAGPIGFQWGDNGEFKAFVVIDPTTKAAVAGFFNSANGLVAAPEVVREAFNEDVNGIFDWLGYDRYSSSWEASLAGKKCENLHNYAGAIEHFELALSKATDIYKTKIENRIERLKRIIAVKKSPVSMSADELDRYAGNYGVFSLNVNDTCLTFQLSGEEKALIPIGDGEFLVEGDMELRLSFPKEDDKTVQVEFLDGGKLTEKKQP